MRAAEPMISTLANTCSKGTPARPFAASGVLSVAGRLLVGSERAVLSVMVSSFGGHRLEGGDHDERSRLAVGRHSAPAYRSGAHSVRALLARRRSRRRDRRGNALGLRLALGRRRAPVRRRLRPMRPLELWQRLLPWELLPSPSRLGLRQPVLWRERPALPRLRRLLGVQQRTRRRPRLLPSPPRRSTALAGAVPPISPANRGQRTVPVARIRISASPARPAVPAEASSRQGRRSTIASRAHRLRASKVAALVAVAARPAPQGRLARAWTERATRPAVSTAARAGIARAKGSSACPCRARGAALGDA